MIYRVGNFVDKHVDNLMDNSEDNCVENNQELKTQAPQWIETWSKHVLAQYSTGSEQTLDEQQTALAMIQSVLLATLQGDSCVLLQDEQHQDLRILQSLVAEDQGTATKVAPLIYDQNALYLYRYWQLEQRLAVQVARLKQQQINAVNISAFEHLLEDEHQKAAFKMVAENGFNLITGGPGTGKTYTLARMIAALYQAIPNIRIAMAAPTGKAAQRMGEALQHSLSDEKLQSFGLRLEMFNPVTIHRLLGLGNQHIPRFNLHNLLPYDVVVVDEASMLDLNLATMLFEAIPEHCRLILLGDANQLASVDVGSVLADLQQVDALAQNRINLVTSRRFSSDAHIGKMAQFIQQHKFTDVSTVQLGADFEKNIVPSTTIKAVQLNENQKDLIQMEYLPEQVTMADAVAYYAKLSLGFIPYFQAIQHYLAAAEPERQVELVAQAFDQYRILTPIRHGTFGLEKLNIAMEQALFRYLTTHIRQGDWYVGRPVMMTYNDYQLGLSNGDIGICLKHRQQSDQYEVYFPSLDKWLPAPRLPKNMQTAFALTIHKSQGSEFRHTAVVFDASAKQMLSQELIYTAITRAKSIVSLLVHPGALAQSLSVVSQRASGLTDKINRFTNM